MELGANSSVKGTFKVRCSAGMKSFGLCRDRNNFNNVKVHLLAIEFLIKNREKGATHQRKYYPTIRCEAKKKRSA